MTYREFYKFIYDKADDWGHAADAVVLVGFEIIKRLDIIGRHLCGVEYDKDVSR